MTLKTTDKNTADFSERSKRILGAIVKDYILTAEPVGSKAIATRYLLDLSPATIRNIMAELESSGFLTSPHTSAGRIPTEKSFRFYIDSLLELEEPLDNDKNMLRKCSEANTGIENALSRTTKALSALTSCAGLAFMPGKDNFTIKHIRLLPIDRETVMVLIMSRLGMVKTRRVRIDVNGLNLEKTSNYLNTIGSGLTLRALRAKITLEMKIEKNLYDEILSNAFKLSKMALGDDNDDSVKDLFVEGQTKMIEQPEFRDDLARLKEIFAAFEEKNLLIKILDKSIEEEGVHVFMGSQSSIEQFSGLSFVTAPCCRGKDIFGTLGVIGPVRMNYSKILPLVSYTAGLLSGSF